MSAIRSLGVLARRWRVMVLCTLVAIGLSAVYVARATPRYEATAQLFVAAKQTGGVASGLESSNSFGQDRVRSYTDLITSHVIADPVASRYGISAGQLLGELGASAPLGTVLINVHVTDPSPARAQALANAVSAQFASYISTLETTPGEKNSPVKVSVTNRATLPGGPVSPHKTLDLILGFLVGLFVGVGIAVLREALDTTVKTPAQVQNAVGLPILGTIAYDPEASKRPLIIHVNPRSPRAEAFRQLRTNMQFLDVDTAPRSIVVTSSIPEEGKTTTTTNLAIALSANGSRVLLLEGDLRRPRVADYLGLEGSVGLTNVLVDRAKLTEAIQPWGPDGTLHVMASGPIPPNPSELLGSRGMADTLQKLEKTYDLVLIDAPPLLPVTDAAVLSALCDGTLVIARYGRIRQEQLIRAMESLNTVDARTFGIVLTWTPTRGPDATYYGYGYRYVKTEARGSRLRLATPTPPQESGQAV